MVLHIIAPLTSTHGCVSRIRLGDKIAGLEQRISMLYQILEAEKLMDTITFGPAHTGTTRSREPDATGPCPAADSAPPPVIVPDESWVRLGLDPKP